MKILIIEDNQELAHSLAVALGSHAVVEVAHTADQGLEFLENDVFNLLILDLRLPDMTGLAVCQTIRARDLQLPILVLTGVHKPETVIALLNAGADDYLTKPFRVDELQARIRALTRRQEKRPEVAAPLIIGDLVLDTQARTVQRRGRDIYLRNKEFIILELLMSHPNMVFTRTAILTKAWDSSENSWTNIVDVHIKHLRDKIDKPFGTNLIQTVHGLGYRLVSKQRSRPVASKA